MKSARECNDRFEDLAAFVMGELDFAATVELQDHLAICGSCREVCESLREEEEAIQSGFATLARSVGMREQTVLDTHREQRRQSEIYVGRSQKHFSKGLKK